MRARKWILRIVVGLLAVCIVLAGVLALVNRTLPTASTVTERLADEQKALLAELFHVRRELGDATWPGWGAKELPFVVYNEAYAFLLGYEGQPPDGWLKVPQDEPHGGPWEPVPGDTFEGQPYYRQPLPASGETPQAFTVKVGERWAGSLQTREWAEINLVQMFREQVPGFVQPIFPYTLLSDLFLRGSDGYVSLLAHESFHAYQGTVAPQRLAAAETNVGRAEAGYPWTDTVFVEAWQAELDLLAEALRTETEAESRELAQQFLAQRTARREAARLAPTLVDYERHREWLEGLARYVELEIWQQAALADTYEPLTAVQDIPDFDAYGTFERRWSQEIDQIGRMADDEGDGRFYYSGMAQAVLLDRLAPEWKAKALEEGVFLEELLAEAVGVTLD